METNILETSGKNFKELLIEAERVSDVFLEHLGSFKEETKGISKSLPRLSLEIEHLKKARETLASVLAEKMKEAYTNASKALIDQLHASFMEKIEPWLEKQKKAYENAFENTREEFEQKLHEETQRLQQILESVSLETKQIKQRHLEEAETFKQELEKTTSTLSRLISLQKQRLTYRGLLLCGVFCLSSILTGIGLYWFFPQNIYYADSTIARNIIMGRTTWENMSRLSPKDQSLLLEGMKKYMARN